MSAVSCARTEGRAFRIFRLLSSLLSKNAKVPCLPSILEKESVLYGSIANRRSVSLEDASCFNVGDSSAMNCVLLGLLGVSLRFISCTMRRASASISPARRAPVCSLKSPGVSLSRFCFSSRKRNCSASGSLGTASKCSNFPKEVSGFPLKSCQASISLVPCS